MKNFIRLGITAAAFAALFTFTNCTTEQPQGSAAPQGEQMGTAKGIKIAFVDIDSLLTNYEFSKNINKEMLRKEENMRMTLSEKAKEIQADIDDFTRKLQNNVYATQQRAEEEQARILKREEAYNKLTERLSSELAAESQKNNIILRDSINSFLKEYNKSAGYDLIISRLGDNLLYANDALDITKEVINGLNERYKDSEE